MNPVPVLNFQDFISLDGDSLTTTSHKVAAVFGKRHDRVLRAIANLLASLPESHRPIFGAVETIDAKGELRRSYWMTRDGFTLLAMSFTGVKALTFKLAYIDAFNAMAAFIKNQREGLSYQRAKFELEEKDSRRRGSFHGKGLNERKQEIPRLEAEERRLLAVSQPGLFLN